MNPALRNRLIAASAGGAIAIAGALVKWYEGDGPSVRQPDGSVLYKPYKDPVGIWTVCEGITGPDVVPGKVYPADECRTLKVKHLKIAEAAAKKVLIYWDEYDIWTQAALIDFTYNAGPENLASSTMARLFNSGDIVGGCQQLQRWVKGRVKGQLVTLNGLVDRRSAEQEICLKGATHARLP